MAGHARSELFPKRVGRHELLMPLGTGGAATVYLAQSHFIRGVRREVAIKIMHPDLALEREASNELIEEAKIAAAIRDPHVVPVTEVGRDANLVYLVMDYVDGASLAELLTDAWKANARLPDRIAGRILCDALAGLAAAHQLRDDAGVPRQLVHRDFTPQNILVGIDGVTRLTDFGIAKALTRLSMTRTGVVKGKCGYMSPEQACGETLDQRSDVWAAGVMAWELLVGRRLFRGKDDLSTLEMVIDSQPVPRVRSHRSDLSAELDATIARALDKNADGRPKNAEAFRRELVSAWQSLAEPHEVGEYVNAIVGEKLAERRRARAAVAPVRKAAAPRRRSARTLAALAALVALGISVGALSYQSPAVALRKFSVPQFSYSVTAERPESAPAPHEPAPPENPRTERHRAERARLAPSSSNPQRSPVTGAAAVPLAPAPY